MKGKISYPARSVLTNLMVLTMGLLTFLCLFPPDHYFFIQGSQYAAHLMLSFLFLSLVFTLWGNKKLLIGALICTAILAYFLKQSGNSNLNLAPISEEPGVKVAVINLSSLNDDPELDFNHILSQGADLLSFQEVTPDWRHILVKKFKDFYPYEAALIRIDPFGQLIMSKYPIRELDTIYAENIPSLTGLLDFGDGMKTQLFSIHLPPAFDLTTYQLIRSHLNEAGHIIGQTAYPALCMGDFQTVPWSHEIQSFRQLANLEDSRRGFNPMHSLRKAGILDRPLQHIFHSDDFECSAFNALYDQTGEQIGLLGYYQRVPIKNFITSNFEN